MKMTGAAAMIDSGKERQMKRLRFLFACLWVLALVWAAGGAAAQMQGVEASTIVTGSIEVGPDGSVTGYTLDHKDKLQPAAIEVVAATVPHWKFNPILRDGKAVPAKAAMSLRLVARLHGDDAATVSVASAAFGRDADRYQCVTDKGCLHYRRTVSPEYPVDLARQGVGGTVYVVQDINRDGVVMRQAVRRVNLSRTGDPDAMKQWREELANATLDASKRFTYRVPTQGPEAAKDHWTATIPFNFSLEPGRLGRPAHPYGSWTAYIPGPKQYIPWLDSEGKLAGGSGASDAVPEGGAPFVRDSRFVLLTPLAQNSDTKAGDD